MIGYLLAACITAWIGGSIVFLGLALERGSFRLGVLCFAIFVGGLGFVLQWVIDEKASEAPAQYEDQTHGGCTE